MTINIQDPIPLRDKARIFGRKVKKSLKFAVPIGLASYIVGETLMNHIDDNEPTGEKTLVVGDGDIFQMEHGNTPFNEHVYSPFSPVWNDQNISIMCPGLHDQLEGTGKSLDQFTIVKEVDNYGIKLTARDNNNGTVYTDFAPLDKIRGEGKLAEMLRVKDVLIVPKELVDGKAFKMTVDNKNVTDQSYIELQGEKRPIPYGQVDLSLGYEWADDSLIGNFSFKDTGKNQTIKADEQLTANFFDMFDNGKIDGSINEYLKDFKDSVQNKRTQDSLELLYHNAQDSITNLQNIINTINGTHQTEITNLINSYHENITNIYNLMNETVSDAVRENVTALNSQFNQTLSDLDVRLARKVVANKPATGNIFYNGLNNSEQLYLAGALNLTRDQWNELFDDNATELNNMTVMIPGINNTAKVKVATTAGELTGNVSRDYAIALEKMINSNKEELINFTGPGMIPAYLASLKNGTLAAEINKLKVNGNWIGEATYDAANNTKVAALTNLNPEVWSYIGSKWNGGQISKLQFVDTQSSGILVAKYNDGTSEAFALSDKAMNNSYDIFN